MPTTLTQQAIEGGVFFITASFTDEDGLPVTPDTMAWSLVDRRGNAINSRSNVVIDPGGLGSSIEIVLRDADLALADAGQPDRVVVFEGTYTGAAGAGLELREEARFKIQNLALPADA